MLVVLQIKICGRAQRQDVFRLDLQRLQESRERLAVIAAFGVNVGDRQISLRQLRVALRGCAKGDERLVQVFTLILLKPGSEILSAIGSRLD